MCIVHLHVLHNLIIIILYMISCVSVSVCCWKSWAASPIDPARVTMHTIMTPTSPLSYHKVRGGATEASFTPHTPPPPTPPLPPTNPPHTIHVSLMSMHLVTLTLLILTAHLQSPLLPSSFPPPTSSPPPPSTTPPLPVPAYPYLDSEVSMLPVPHIM